MKLAFYRGTSPLSLLIKARTNGEFSHVEYLFSDGALFSSVIEDSGTRFTNSDDLTAHPKLWEVVDVGAVLNETALRAWCESKVGEKYGFVGDICLFLNIRDFDARHPFCSQVVLAGAQAQGVWKFTDPTRTTPEELYLIASACAEMRAAA
jgi:hypothetical protein